ncbi:hypothetical protein B0H11DRAFT_2034256 [Mycena galericulata]|nr:hypothetical protein B0H11DRAFT_2034256 [Mycena galericulata]
MSEYPTFHPNLSVLVQRLGGDVYAWLEDEASEILHHGPVTSGSEHVAATYYIPGVKLFRICWKSLNRPITALCAVIRPPLPGQTLNCRAAIHVMDQTIPDTQTQISPTPSHGNLDHDLWFSGPAAFETGFVRLEFFRAVKDDGIYRPDPANADCPPLVLRFDLVGIPDQNRVATPIPSWFNQRFRQSMSPSPEPMPPRAHTAQKRKRTEYDEEDSEYVGGDLMDLLVRACPCLSVDVS